MGKEYIDDGWVKVFNVNVYQKESENSAKFSDNTFWNSNDKTSYWAKIVIFHTKTSSCCKMAVGEDTECPNISTCSFFKLYYHAKFQGFLQIYKIGQLCPCIKMRKTKGSNTVKKQTHHVIL